jgi:hypothetical protein
MKTVSRRTTFLHAFNSKRQFNIETLLEGNWSKAKAVGAIFAIRNAGV